MTITSPTGTVVTLVPEEALGAFVGEDPNGTWTLTVSDDMAGDAGTLRSWSVRARTTKCSTPQPTTSPSPSATTTPGPSATTATPTPPAETDDRVRGARVDAPKTLAHRGRLLEVSTTVGAHQEPLTVHTRGWTVRVIVVHALRDDAGNVRHVKRRLTVLASTQR